MDAYTYEAIKVVSESLVLIVFALVMASVVLRWRQSGVDRGSEEKAVDSEVAQASTVEDSEEDDDDEEEDEGEGDFIRLDKDELLTLFKWILTACVVCLCGGILAAALLIRLVG